MKRIITFVLLISSYGLIHGNEILKFDEYIKVIEEKLPDVKLNENQVKSQEFEVMKSYSIYDVNLDSKFYGLGNQTYPDNENTIYNYSPGFGTSFTITNTLPSGTQISTGFTYEQKYTSGEITSVNSITDIETTLEWQKTSYKPVINIGVTQPLLYNWFGFLNRYGIKNEKNKLKIEKITQELNTLSILNDYKKLYFQWIAVKYKLDLIDKTIKNTKLQLVQTRKKVKLGLLEQDSLETINYSLLQYEKQKKEYEMSYESIKNQLSYFFDLNNYEPDEVFFNQIYEEYSNKEFDFIDFSKTKNARILNLSKENYELLKKARINQILPRLDLFANIDINFRYAREVYDGEENIYTFSDNNSKNIDFTMGIELSFPLGNIEARNNLNEALILIENIVLEYEKTKQNYEYNLMNVLSYNQYVKNLVIINNQSIKSLSKKYNSQIDQYKKGIIGLQDVVDTDNLMTTEKMNEIDIKVNLINNLIDYEYLIE